eukprot:scaffold9.g3260.t1
MVAQLACAATLCGPSTRPAPFAAGVPARPRAAALPAQRRRALRLRANSEAEQQEAAPAGSELDDSDSEAARKKAEAERLRAAEKFMKVGTGEAECKGCGYVYLPNKGDPEYPVAPGTTFGQLPDDWQCPVCGAGKSAFVPRQKEVAGFAENQGYGLGTNTMTGDQKSLLIFGSLAFVALLLLGGYTLN